jgi:hypothetical protein
MTCGDPIGEAVVRLGFKNSDHFRILGKTHRLVDESNPKVTKYMGILSSFDTSSCSTQVAQRLVESYSKLESSLKTEYPGVLSDLQRTLTRNNIRELSQLPKTREELLNFFEDVPINEASLFLIQDGFNLTIPEFSGRKIVGYGYDLLNDDVLSSPVFNMHNEVRPSEVLFQFPKGFTVEMLNRIEHFFTVVVSKEGYVEARLNSLGLDKD